ncbi:MAG: endolytic transglycosylase MltG [bacterium]|nr:endolytic transglycosylase MltG [Candidatus Kapabacteria bacterium]
MAVARRRGVHPIVLVLIGIVLIFVGYIAWELWLRSGSSDEVIVRIPEGASFTQILDSLESSGAISNRAAFKLLATATGDDAHIRPGTYKFERGTASAQLLSALVEGRSTVKVKVTFPEGITIRRMASILSRDIGIDSSEFVSLANNREFLKSVGINASTAEGYLLPDTYFLFFGEDARTLLQRLIEEFRAFYDDEMKERAKAIGLDAYDAIILASIVEGEARVDEERPVIAGLYLNRLRRGIKLAADPTIQYMLPDGPRRILYRDLRIDNPYNTYMYAGLPPSPINNPGRSSIRAALSPSKHDYIYMVAKADGSGRHTFTRTGSEHDRAVREYRKRVDTSD